MFVSGVLERIFGRTIEDLTRRADENYTGKSSIICILPQIFLGRLNEGGCGRRDINYVGGDVRSISVRKL